MHPDLRCLKYVNKTQVKFVPVEQPIKPKEVVPEPEPEPEPQPEEPL